MMSDKPDVPSVLTSGSSTVQVDPEEPKYAPLAVVAGRIRTLVDDTVVQGDPDVLRSLDDLLGAIYALFLAIMSDFQDRSDRTPELQPVITRAGQLERGEIRLA